MIRVLLADDHGVIRDGLGRLIEALDDVELAGTASDGAEAVERARDLQPDVILMDLEMPNMDGIEATRRILEERPEAAVLVLTSFSDRSRILGALDAGARGYLLKDVASEEVAAGLRGAAPREAPLAPRAAPAVRAARPRSTRARPGRSSRRARSPTRSARSRPASERSSRCWPRGCPTSSSPGGWRSPRRP